MFNSYLFFLLLVMIGLLTTAADFVGWIEIGSRRRKTARAKMTTDLAGEPLSPYLRRGSTSDRRLSASGRREEMSLAKAA